MDFHLFSIIFGSAVIIGATGYGVGLAVAMSKADEEMDAMESSHKAKLFNARADAWNRGYHAGQGDWIKAEGRPVKQ